MASSDTNADSAPSVLIVDDHPLFRMGLAMALKAEGFTVVGEAENGRQAVERCRHTHVDVVLLDVRMAELDGISACVHHGRAERTVAVMLTTFEEPAVIRPRGRAPRRCLSKDGAARAGACCAASSRTPRGLAAQRGATQPHAA